MSTSDSVGKSLQNNPQITPPFTDSHRHDKAPANNYSPDRVFVHALATVRRLPRTGSSRPPPSARLRLYGLYKQSMEGDVLAILPRPTLPPPSPALNDSSSPSETTKNTPATSNNGNQNNNNNANAVHRYASRDLRTREAQAEIEKWDAWHACAGMTRTEAKRRYISTLIETMKEYASGTSESRELVGELEFVWSQIQNQNSQSSAGSGSGSGREGEGSSPRRSGMSIVKMDSFTGELPGRSGGRSMSGVGMSRRDTEKTGGMRVLSPVSQRDPEDVVEGTEDDDERPEAHPLPLSSASTDPSQWRTSIEDHLRRLSTEIAALREQLSSNHLLSSSSYSPYTYHQLSLRWKIWYRILAWGRWFAWAAVRQVAINIVILAALLLWGRWRGDKRMEEWAKRRWREVRSVLGRIYGTLDLRLLWRVGRILGGSAA